MLRYAGERRSLVTVVDDGGALIIALRPEDLEVQGPVAQPARTVVEIAVDRPAVDHMGERLGQIFESRAEPHLEPGRIKDGGDQFRVAALWHRLMRMGEIRVVVVEAQRQTF